MLRFPDSHENVRLAVFNRVQKTTANKPASHELCMGWGGRKVVKKRNE